MTPVNTGPAARIGKLGALCALALTATLACSTPSPTPPAASPTSVSAAPTSVGPSPSESATSTSPVETSETPSASASAETAACTADDLRIGLKKSAGGAGMGSLFVLLTFTNTSAGPCTLYGWPGVSLVGKGDGTQLGAAATRVQPDDRRVITLAADQQTTALLKISQARAYPAAKCGPVTADGFRVYAPGEKAAAFVKRSTPACSKKASKILAVAPVGTKG